MVNLETDSWGYEISIEITKPDGTKDTWPTYSFNSNAAYSPLRSYTDAGNYTLDVADCGATVVQPSTSLKPRLLPATTTAPS